MVERLGSDIQLIKKDETRKRSSQDNQISRHMSHISSCIYKDEKDTQIMIGQMAGLWPFDHLDDYPTKVHIEEKLALAMVRSNTRLWFDEDQAIGFGYVDDFNNLDWEFEN